MVYLWVRVTVMVSELSVSGSETFIAYTKLSLCLTFHLLFGQEPHRLIPSYWELICEEIKCMGLA